MIKHGIIVVLAVLAAAIAVAAWLSSRRTAPAAAEPYAESFQVHRPKKVRMPEGTVVLTAPFVE